MSAQQLEAFLARLYTDATLRARFLDAPEATARAAGLPAVDVAAMLGIDRAGLEAAAESYTAKRASKAGR